MKTCFYIAVKVGAGLVVHLLLTLLIITAPASYAGSHTWSGAVDGAWSTPGNWSSGGRPTNGEPNLQILFPISATRYNSTNNLAGLEIQNLTITGSGYVIEGFGVGTNVSLVNGAIVTSSGVGNNLGGNLNLTFLDSATFQVNSGSALTVASKLQGIGNPVHKYGDGTLTFSCANANTYTGTTTVHEGTLRLENGFPFLSTWISAVAVPGPLIIGSTVSPYSAKVLFMQSGQTSTNSAVTIYDSGTLDLDGHDGTVGAITIIGGAIKTGTGTLTMNDNLTANHSPAAYGTISGKLSLSDEPRTFNVTDGMLIVDAVISGEVSGRGSGGISKIGAGTLTLGADTNTYPGQTFVNAGSLLVFGNRGLGSTGGNTSVANGAQLELSTALVGSEPLTLRGTGTNATSGALIVFGSNSWSGTIALPEDATIRGAAASDIINISGVISGAGGLTTTGNGRVILSGSQPNTYSGTTHVKSTLHLGKSNDVTAIAGPLIIGEFNNYNSDTDIVATLASDQIANNVPVTIHPSGLLNISTNEEALSDILMAGGQIDSTTGTLWLFGNLKSTNVFLFGAGTISGKLSLAGFTRTIHLPEDGDLKITATISGIGLADGIVKTGDGILHLHGANTYPGITTINGGEVMIYTATSLGSTANGTVVASGAALTVQDAVVGNESLSLSGTGVNGDALRIYLASSWDGNIFCATDTSIGLPNASGLFIVTGTISGPGVLTKTGAGTLRFIGSTDNGLPGVVVKAGGLNLGKTSGASAIAGFLEIGNDVDPVSTTSVTLMGNNQIDNSTPVIIHKSGIFYIGGFNDTIGPLVFTGGSTDGGVGILTVNGDVFMTNAALSAMISCKLSLGSSTRNFVVDGTLSVNEVINETGVGAGITKTGAGALNLNAANTYSGPTTINEGYLRLSGSGRPGSAGAGTVIAEGASLYLYNSGTISSESLTLAGEGPDELGALRSFGIFGTTNVWSGPITLSSAVTVGVLTSDADLVLSGAIGGSGAFTKVGEGTLVFSGISANTYSGTTRVKLGRLQLKKTAGINAVPGTLQIGEEINQFVTAEVEVLSDSQIADISGLVSVYSSGYFKLVTGNEGIAGLYMRGGFLNTFGKTLTLYGHVTAEESAFTISSIEGILSLNGGMRTFNLLSNAVIYFDAQLVNGGPGAAGIQKSGPGTLYLQASNTFTGPTIVSGGTLQLQDSYGLGSNAGGVTVSNGARLFLEDQIHVLDESLSLAGNGTGFGAFLSFGTNSWTGPIVLAEHSTFASLSSNSLLHLNGPISGTNGLAVVGTGGKIRIGGNTANSYSGSTTVSQAILELSKTNGAALPGSLMVNFNGTVRHLLSQQIGNQAAVNVAATGLLDLAGKNETVGSLAGAGTVSLGTGTLTTGGDNSSTTFSGAILGSSNPAQIVLTKLGTGTMTLSGNNTFTGETIVNGGKLIINGSQPGTVQVLNNAMLGGSGTVGTIMALSGGISPGNSPGKLNCAEILSGPGASLVIELNGTNAVTEYDQLNVNGTANLDGSLIVSLNFPSAVSNQFIIVNKNGSDPIVSGFPALPEGSTLNINHRQFKISYLGGDGNDVVLTQISEPLPGKVDELLRYADHIELIGTGTPGVPYTVQANHDLTTTNWVSIGTAPANGSGKIYTLDADSNNYPIRFYRLRLP